MAKPDYELTIEMTNTHLMSDLSPAKRRGVLLRALREREGLSQRQLAEECTDLGYPLKGASLHRIEDGSRPGVHVGRRDGENVLDNIVHCLEVSPHFSSDDVNMFMTHGGIIYDGPPKEPRVKAIDQVPPRPISYTREYGDGEVTTLFVGDTGVEFSFGLPHEADQYDRVALREILQHGITGAIRGFLREMGSTQDKPNI